MLNKGLGYILHVGKCSWVTNLVECLKSTVAYCAQEWHHKASAKAITLTRMRATRTATRTLLISISTLLKTYKELHNNV